MEQIISGNVRVQLLSKDIVRIEYGEKERFCDENTFFIPNKSSYDKKVAYAQKNGAIVFGEYELCVPENAKSLAGVCLYKNGKKVYTYKKLANSGELPPLNKTPEVFAISDTPRITVPEGGYSVNRKGEYKTEENVRDVYLLLCKKDAKLLRKLYVELTGKPELVRLSTLGGWNSKYYAYTEDEAKQLILDYEKYDVPLDVMVIDTDWRSCENGWGYDINEKLFPDMKRFLDFAHAHGVEVMFNDHPEPVDGAHVFEEREIAYREKNLQAIMDLGLDIWWYDRNWSTKLISPSEDVNCETLGLYLFADVTANYYKKVWNSDKVYRRPVIMGNVDNIANGCYAKIYSSASHRYSVQWTGDIQSNPDALASEIATMIKAGNNAIPYCNADCGGHLGNPNKEGFIRWMQFGNLSPVYRPHCTNYVKRWRDPWAYDEETLNIVREYDNLRYRLLPVIYKNAYNAYDTGEPVFKSLGYEYGTDKRALERNDEYMLGNDILVKPIAGNNAFPVNKKDFISPVKCVYYNGTELKGEPIAKAEYDSLDISLNHTSPEKGVPVYYFSARFETVVRFEKDVELIVRCDDGATVWIDGEKVFEDKTLHSAMNFPLKIVEGCKPHKVEIEYFQAGGEAAIGLYYCDVKTDDAIETYLPAGSKWLDVFDGALYVGGKTASREYDLREMPLFVRAGAILPIAYEAHNTKLQKWDRLVLDWYADKSSDDAGYIYEDDTETTAYKYGKYRTTEYAAGYSSERNVFVLNIQKAKGGFDGDKCFKTREITVKRHVLGGARAVKATVNGEEIEITRAAKNKKAFPLDTCADAPDGECESITFAVDADKAYNIEFVL